MRKRHLLVHGCRRLGIFVEIDETLHSHLRVCLVHQVPPEQHEERVSGVCPPPYCANQVTNLVVVAIVRVVEYVQPQFLCQLVGRI